ncbi:MAG TPA: hypothetical protein VEU62_15630 [Bryobacterales bacterium]|nr:hypothetical protein [Bryobacterales bacterium]
MDVERTIEFILEHEARIDARLEMVIAHGDQLDARVDQLGARVDQLGARLDQLGALVKENSAQIRKLTAAQAKTDYKLKIVGTMVGAGMKRLQKMDRTINRLEHNIERLVAGMMRQPPNGRRR